ncbi:MAG: hypothetical protein H5T86_09120, partial [Armatimonadetes bacterium]|nr:hypothetical protein [Armatimonadota bacterium]
MLDPARGGTVTELRWRGGRNLADRSFGTAWGAWGRYDPLHPHISADKFLSRESKHYQWEKPAKVTVASRSPAHVEIVVEQQQSGLPISQRYRFFAFSPFFQVTSTVTATEDVDLRSQGIDEIVWLDIPLRRGSWTKIYPNFTGQSSGEAVRFHDGWREGPAEPPVATIMDHSTLRCSLSVLCPNPLSAVDGPWFRQGFFPEKRGSTGEPTVARLEFIERFAPTIDATWAVWRKGSLRKNETVGGKTITVVLHDGSQAVAEDLAKAGLVVSGQVGQAAPEARPAAAAGQADWWFEAYDARAPVAQQLSDQGLVVQWPLRVGEKWIDPATIRAVWQSEDGPQVLQAAAIVTASGSAAVSVEPPQVKLGDGRLYLYGQLTEKLPLGPAELEAGVPNPSFEAGRSGWGFAGAVLDQTTGHSGNASVRLEATKAEGAYA